METNYRFKEKLTPDQNSLCKVITLVSMKDGTRVEIDIRSTRLSGLLTYLVDEFIEEEFLIPEIDSFCLDKIAEFLNHYNVEDPKEVPKPLETYDLAALYGTWDENFISKLVDKTALWNLLEAANFMDCKSLLELVASKVAYMIKDFSGDEMLHYFGLKEDMTSEDVERMEEEFEKEMHKKCKV